MKFLSFSTQYLYKDLNEEKEISDLIPKYWKDILKFPSEKLTFKEQWKMYLDKDNRIKKEYEELNKEGNQIVKKLSKPKMISKSIQIQKEDYIIEEYSNLRKLDSLISHDSIPPIIYTGDPDFSSDPILTFEGILKTCLANT